MFFFQYFEEEKKRNNKKWSFKKKHCERSFDFVTICMHPMIFQESDMVIVDGDEKKIEFMVMYAANHISNPIYMVVDTFSDSIQ